MTNRKQESMKTLNSSEGTSVPEGGEEKKANNHEALNRTGRKRVFTGL